MSESLPGALDDDPGSLVLVEDECQIVSRGFLESLMPPRLWWRYGLQSSRPAPIPFQVVAQQQRGELSPANASKEGECRDISAVLLL